MLLEFLSSPTTRPTSTHEAIDIISVLPCDLLSDLLLKLLQPRYSADVSTPCVAVLCVPSKVVVTVDDPNLICQPF